MRVSSHFCRGASTQQSLVPIPKRVESSTAAALRRCCFCFPVGDRSELVGWASAADHTHTGALPLLLLLLIAHALTHPLPHPPLFVVYDD